MVVTEQSTFNQIRTLLAQAERDAAAIRREPIKAEQAIRAVEQAESLLNELRAQRADIRAEAGRAESTRGRLLREAQLVERQVVKSGRAEALAGSALFGEIRASEAQRRRRLRRNAITGGSAALIVALLLFVVLPRVFPAPPSANTVAVVQIASSGDLEGALARAQAEQAQAPNDQQIGVLIAALQQQLGRPETEQSWQDARAQIPNEIDFLSERATVELTLGNSAAAERSAEQLRALPEGAAIGTYQLASVRELQGRNSEAIQLYEQAGKLAEQEGKVELVVVARQRMATLMQMPP